MWVFAVVVGVLLTIAIAVSFLICTEDGVNDFSQGMWASTILIIGLILTLAVGYTLKKGDTETYNISKIIHYTAPAEEEILQVWLEKDGEYFYIMVDNKEYQSLNVDGGTVKLSEKEIDKMMTSRR